jgi:diguanylate cyclase (GGDEF)-like protein
MTSTEAGALAAQRLRRVHPLSLAIGLMVALALVIDTTLLRDVSLHHGLAPSVWLVLLGITFLLVEVLPLHIEWAGQAYSLSLSEAPLVIGLLVCPTREFALARVLGGALALFFFRKQPRHKLAFNVALQLLEVSVAVALFTALAGHGRVVPMAAAPAVLITVIVSSTVTVAAVCTAVRLHVGVLDRAVVKSFARLSAFGIVVNTSLALVLTTALDANVTVVAPMCVMLLAVTAIYRAYVLLRDRHASLEMLYQFTSGLNQATPDNRIRDILQRTGAMLRADLAGVVLLGSDSNEPPVIRWLGPDGELRTEDYDVGTDDSELTDVARTGSIVVLSRSSRDAAQHRFLQARGLRDAVLAPLQLEGDIRGVLFVANRQGDVASFTDDDGKLFHTVAAHVSSVLDNSRLLDRLTHDSLHDALTGLANRQCYQSRLRTALSRDAARFAVLLIDLDQFKEINDTLGHHHGDLLIREIAGRIADATPATATVARLGGDEFALLVPGLDATAASELASRIRSEIRKPCTLDGVSLQVDASIGVAAAPEHGDDDSVLLKRADMAMYAAKSSHTGVEVYDHERDEYSPRRLALASKLRDAIATSQLVLHYQPQVDAASGNVVGVEALVRWQHPELGLVPPLEFVPIAEQSGLIGELTIWVLTNAVRQLAAWRDAGLRIGMSVNVSMRDLRDTAVIETLRQLQSEYGVASSMLTLEITESHIMSDPARTLPVLHELAALGIRLSVDDFGTGYSSLSYLKDLPVHEVKIDKSFIATLGRSQRDDAIVRAVVSLAEHLGLDTVAEGIEDEHVRRRVAALGCTRLQGYHLGRPLPAREFLHWLTVRSLPSQPHVSADGMGQLEQRRSAV